MSSLTQAMVINAVVLFAVLEADLGPHRKIGWFRVARPLGMAAAIVPLYLTALTTHGTGLSLEIAGAVAGVLLGLLATSQMAVYRSPHTGKAASRAGYGYALVWIAVIGARAAFSYGSSHWFSNQLGNWMGRHQISVDGLTNTLILMAVAMLLTRTFAMAARVRALPIRPAAQTGTQEAVRDFANGL
jgi:hypothetical protein